MPMAEVKLSWNCSAELPSSMPQNFDPQHLSFSQACENNKGPIGEVLKQCFAGCKRVLEVGSGTGQHALHFAALLPQLVWQASERHAHMAALQARHAAYPRSNLPPPIALDAAMSPWPNGFDGIFSANTLHIMPWEQGIAFFKNAANACASGAKVAVYGPFNYNGTYTSESNHHFDLMLRQRNAAQGIRGFEQVNDTASAVGLHMLEDYPMPANNRLIVWQRR